VYDHAAEFTGRPVWLFSSGPLGFPLKPHESKAVDIRRIAGAIRLKEHRVFAGKLKRHRLDLAEKVITMAVHAPQGDFRNWEEIRAWAAGIAQSLKRQAASKRIHA
jgi:menaquinone-dependent protoporphyrinogen oxidase